MAKFSLTINTDSPGEITAVLSALGNPGFTAYHSNGTPAVTFGNVQSNDDDNEPVNTAAPAVDSAGIPWDERIHAKSKTTKADGTWKRGRGVTDEQAAAVEAELRARVASPIPAAGNVGQPPVQNFQPPQPPQSAPAQQGGVALTPAQPTQQPGIVQQPAQTPPAFTAPIPAQPAQTPVQSQPSGFDFGQLMTGLQRAMQAGKIDMNGANALVPEINAAWAQYLPAPLTMITDLAKHPQTLEWVKEMLVQRGIWVD